MSIIFPEYGGYSEVGQPTFVELIRAYEVATAAINTSDINPTNSLRSLAYKRPRRSAASNQPTATPPSFMATGGVPYTVSSQSATNPSAIESLRAAKAYVEFRDLVKNDATPCPSISGDGAPAISPICSEGCKIDIVIAIDLSGSMANEIDTIKTGISNVIDLIDSVSNGSYRLSLITFGESDTSGNSGPYGRPLLRLPLTTEDCGNIERFRTAMNNVNVNLNGYVEPWHDVMRIVATNEVIAGHSGTPIPGLQWTFRSDADAKLLFIITDEQANGVPDPSTSQAYDVDGSILYEYADALAACGIQLALAWTFEKPAIATQGYIDGAPSNYDTIFTEMTRRTNGFWANVPNGQNMLEYFTSFILGTCLAEVPPKCPGGQNKIINGTFDTGVAGWSDISTSGTVEWNETKQAMKLTGIAIQVMQSLTPGDLVVLSFTAYADTSRSLTYSIYEEPRLADAVPLKTATATVSPLPKRYEITTTVPISGLISIVFDAEQSEESEEPTTESVNIDNVLACVLKEDDCGSGSRNAVTNPNFDSGLLGWTNANGDQLPDTSQFWDNSINALIIAFIGTPEARTTVELKPHSPYTLNFELASFEPEIDTLEFTFGIMGADGSTISSRTVTRAESPEYPTRYQLWFISGSETTHTIFMRAGVISGTVKIRNVLICENFGTCDPGYTNMSYDDFSVDKGAWSGGTHVLLDEVIRLDAEETISSTYTGLIDGQTVQLTFDSVIGTNDPGSYKVEFHTGSVIDQFNIGATAGIKSKESIVRENGTTTIKITNTSTHPADIGNILVCSKDVQACDGNISGLKVMVEWDGIPRQPVNIFNAIVRYTIRNPNDPLDLNVVTTIPSDPETTPGVTGCSQWIRQLPLYEYQLPILADSLTQTAANAAEEGNTASITARSNFVWAIASDGSLPDVMTAYFLEGPQGLIESIEVLLLMNAINLEDYDQTLPPPLECAPDPAENLLVTINYMSSTNVRKEFTTSISLSDIYAQDSESDLNWDSGLDRTGIKGETARWESVLFVIDSVDGFGLDQCTVPAAFETVGFGEFTLPELTMSGSGVAVDPCDAEVIITTLNNGQAINEVQTIQIPNAYAGSWDLSFTYGGVTETATFAWDATSTILRNTLSEFSNINGVTNISVIGDGSPNFPFYIEFKNELGGINHELMVADGSALIGTAVAYVTTVTNGTTNERQIISPSQGAGDFALSFNGVESILIARDASLNDRQAILEAMSSIGVGNVLVTGGTTDRDAAYTGDMIIDFIGDLANQNLNQIVSSSSDYTVSTAWSGGTGVNEKQDVVVEATGGTFALTFTDNSSWCDCDVDVLEVQKGSDSQSEVQWITILPSAERGSFTITYNGQTTQSLNYDASAETVASALNALANITEVNVSKVESASTSYRITFDQEMGDIPPVSVTSDLEYSCSGESYRTAPIPYNATESVLKEFILDGTYLTNADIKVTGHEIDESGDIPQYRWTLEWIGDYARTNMKPVAIDATQLRSGTVIIKEEVQGVGAGDRKRLEIIKAYGGYFKLKATVGNQSEWTTEIPWNTKADGLKSQLLQLSMFTDPDDITILEEQQAEPTDVLFTITFASNLGGVGLEASFQESLLCDPLPIIPVIGGPYDYEVPDCDELSNIVCSPGPLLCKPGESDGTFESGICCSTIQPDANIASDIQIERDLFDPNTKTSRGTKFTIRELALLRGINPNNYAPYYRSWETGTLSDANWSDTINTKQSIVLIETSINTDNGKNRVMNKVAHSEILRKRMFWPQNGYNPEA